MCSCTKPDFTCILPKVFNTSKYSSLWLYKKTAIQNKYFPNQDNQTNELLKPNGTDLILEKKQRKKKQ